MQLIVSLRKEARASFLGRLRTGLGSHAAGLYLKLIELNCKQRPGQLVTGFFSDEMGPQRSCTHNMLNTLINWNSIVLHLSLPSHTGLVIETSSEVIAREVYDLISFSSER